jgi:hypothetical protein
MGVSLLKPHLAPIERIGKAHPFRGKKKPAPENRYRLFFQKPKAWLFGCAGKI